MRVSFNTYAPDVAPEILGGQGLIQALNCVKDPVGYRSLPALAEVTGPTGGDYETDATGEELLCAISGRAPLTGAAYNLIATENEIYYAGGGAAWGDINATGAYAGSAASKIFNAAQFQAYLVVVSGVTGCEPIEKAMGYAGDCALLDSTYAPQANHVMSLGSHVVMGGISDLYVGHAYGTVGTWYNGLWWSARDNAKSWPEVGTAAALAAQSDYRILTGTGGSIHSLLSDGAVGWVLQEEAIWRMDYVGGATMFEIHNVVEGQGAVLHNMATRTPIGIAMITNAGWGLFDGQKVDQIGSESFNRTFMAEFRGEWDDTAASRWSMEWDPGTTKVYCVFDIAGTGQKRIVIWDWKKNEFTITQETCRGRMGVLYVRQGTIYEESPRVGVFVDETTHDSYRRWTGAAQTATFETGDIESNPGGRGTLVSGKPLIQGTKATMTPTLYVAARDDLSDAVVWGDPITLNDWDRFDIDDDARYHRIKMTIAGTWDTASGIDLDFVPSGAV